MYSNRIKLSVSLYREHWQLSGDDVYSFICSSHFSFGPSAREYLLKFDKLSEPSAAQAATDHPQHKRM